MANISSQETGKGRVTASEASLSRKQQLRIILRVMVANNGIARMSDIYRAVEDEEYLKLKGFKLSKQGQASLRETVNRYAVKMGYVSKDPKGWRITSKGK